MAVKNKLEAHASLPINGKDELPINQASGGPGWGPVVAVTGYECVSGQSNPTQPLSKEQHMLKSSFSCRMMSSIFLAAMYLLAHFHQPSAGRAFYTQVTI